MSERSSVLKGEREKEAEELLVKIAEEARLARAAAVVVRQRERVAQLSAQLATLQTERKAVALEIPLAKRATLRAKQTGVGLKRAEVQRARNDVDAFVRAFGENVDVQAAVETAAGALAKIRHTYGAGDAASGVTAADVVDVDDDVANRELSYESLREVVVRYGDLRHLFVLPSSYVFEDLEADAVQFWGISAWADAQEVSLCDETGAVWGGEMPVLATLRAVGFAPTARPAQGEIRLIVRTNTTTEFEEIRQTRGEGGGGGGSGGDALTEVEVSEQLHAKRQRGLAKKHHGEEVRKNIHIPRVVCCGVIFFVSLSLSKKCTCVGACNAFINFSFCFPHFAGGAAPVFESAGLSAFRLRARFDPAASASRDGGSTPLPRRMES